MRRAALIARLLGLVLLVGPALPAAAEPALEQLPGGGVALSGLPALFARQEVRDQLATGLTTTLAFEVEASGGGRRLRGGARTDVRYELWDEVYLITALDVSGRVSRAKLPSLDALAAWWREQKVEVLRAPGPAAGGAPWKVDVRLRVLPFSQAEQADAQRWFSQSLAEPKGGAGAVGDAVRDRPPSFDQVLQVLFSTSIGRPAILEYSWKIDFPPSRKR
jgi:hypothetical protein